MNRHSRLLATSVCLAIGCTAKPGLAGTEDPMPTPSKTFRVSSADDLGLPLYQALQEQIQASQQGAASLEVVLAPGVYETTAISIKDGSPASKLDITLRGDKGPPPVIKVPVDLAGANIRMENLVIADVAVSHPVTTLRVGKSLEVKGVSWVDNQRGEENLSDPLVKIQASYRTGPQKISFADSWFVGNQVAGTANLISLLTVRPDIVSELRFSNTAFVANRASVVVAPEFSERVVFDKSFVHQTDGDAFLWIRNTVSQVVFSDGVFAFKGSEAPVRQKGTSPIPAADFKKPTFANTVTFDSVPAANGLQAYATQQAKLASAPQRASLQSHLD